MNNFMPLDCGPSTKEDKIFVTIITTTTTTANLAYLLYYFQKYMYVYVPYIIFTI